MTPFAHLEKSAYRGRAFAHGAVDAFDALRQMITRRGGGAVKAMHGFADKIPGKQLGKSISDPMVQSADKWRTAGTGATAGAVGGTVGVGLSRTLQDIFGVSDDKSKPNWVANAKPMHMRDGLQPAQRSIVNGIKANPVVNAVVPDLKDMPSGFQQNKLLQLLRGPQ